jgi:HEPN domain-containing protein
MKPVTSEWVAKAEGDFNTARREMEAEPANYDAVCFHSQQCAEKYLKARLIEDDAAFPKTHDLSALLDMVLPIEPRWTDLRSPLDRLTDLGVEVRYPGLFADAEAAAEALETAGVVRDRARKSLELET